MIEGRSLPAQDQIARACGAGTAKQPIVTAAAFSLRAKDRGKLSVDWVQCKHVDPKARNITGSLARLSAYLTHPNQRVAILAVGEVRAICRNGDCLDAVENPHKRRPCHSAIVGLTENGPGRLELEQDLADLANLSPHRHTINESSEGHS